jgi:SSS family transporter
MNLKRFLRILFFLRVFLHISSAQSGTELSLGIDEFLSKPRPEYRGKKLGLCTNTGGVNHSGKRTIQLLEQEFGLDLLLTLDDWNNTTSFSNNRTSAVAKGPSLDQINISGTLPVQIAELIKDLDALFVDLQGIGIRSQSYTVTLQHLLHAGGIAGTSIIILDRPNPLGGEMVSGNIPQESLESPTSFIPIPYRHGMTIGELARLLNTENDHGAELMIIPMDNWQGQPWSEIGLDWVPISPGISTVDDLERFTITSILGADGIIENGVSTDRPYEILVHPKITSGSDIVFALDELLPAVSVPNTGPFAGQICNGISITVTDIKVLEPWTMAIEIAEKIKTIYPDIEFTQSENALTLFDKAVGSTEVRESIATMDWKRLSLYKAAQGEQVIKFKEVRQRYLIYPRRNNFSSLDMKVLFGYIGLIVLIGVIVGRKQRDTKSYFLGNGQISWLMISFSVVATETSVLTFLSIPGVAYLTNFGFLQVAIGYIIGRIVVAWLFLPLYYKEGIQSTYEFIGNKWGISFQRFVSTIFLLMRILADGVRLFMTAIPLTLITGWSFGASIAIIGLFTLIYTLIGGIRSVVYTDTIQFILYIFGAILTFNVINELIPGGLENIISILEEAGKFSIFQGFSSSLSDLLTRPYNFIAAVLGGFLLSMASHGTDHLMVQRLLSAGSIRDGQKALVLSGFLVFLQFAIFLFLGATMWILYDGLPLKPNLVFPWFILTHLPPGFTGFLVAGIFAAAMSTLSSSINSLASATVVDWIKPINPTAGLITARWISIFWAIVLIGGAMLFTSSESPLVEVGLSIASVIYGAILGFFILRLTNWHVSNKSVFWGFSISIILMIYLWKATPLAWTWYVFFGTIIMLTISVILPQFQNRVKPIANVQSK